MRALLRIVPVVAAVLLTACGNAPDLPHESATSVTITPASASLRVGQTVDLTGTAVGFTKPTISWWQQDQHDHAVNGFGEENCDNVTAGSPNGLPSCPYGYLTGSPMMEASTATATYHAPSTPGTYHVTFRAFQVSGVQIGAGVEKRITAAITVTP